jgi:hypothetical protein
MIALGSKSLTGTFDSSRELTAGSRSLMIALDSKSLTGTFD